MHNILKCAKKERRKSADCCISDPMKFPGPVLGFDAGGKSVRENQPNCPFKAEEALLYSFTVIWGMKPFKIKTPHQSCSCPFPGCPGGIFEILEK